MLVIVGH